MSWPLPQSANDLLGLAYGYPFAAPNQGFLLRDGVINPLEEACFNDRIPVLAHGSNRAPSQLARKFPEGEIPVTRGGLRDFTVVYAACLTRYGACPSLLLPCPGSRVRLALTWLTRAQLKVMHLTEGSYGFGDLTADYEAEEGPSVDHVYLYHSPHGALLLDGEPRCLAAVEAYGKITWPRLAQKQMLSAIQRLLGIEGSLDDFALGVIRDPTERRRLIRRLGDHSRDSALPGFRPVEELAFLPFGAAVKDRIPATP